MMWSSLFVVAMLGGASAFLTSDYDGKWSELKVHWGVNIFSSDNFAKMPRTTKAAYSAGFRRVSDCKASASGNWTGARYVKDKDYSLVLIYDINNYIAGVQTTVPPSGQKHGYPSKSIQPPFMMDGDNFIVTAYFVDPAIICTTGRSDYQYEQQGTGTDLYIQNGTDAVKDSIKVPNVKSDLADTKWTEGKYFLSMGKHYWYNLSKDMNCAHFFPVFLLFKDNRMSGFGWAMGTDLKSNRYEHPPKASLSFFFKDVPTCLKETTTRLTTQHIFFT